MIKIIVGISLSALLALGAFADNGPVNEPGQVHTLSPDAIDVTSVLLNHQLKDCVSQIQESGYEFLWSKVESQVMSPDETVYEFSAMLLLGDMGVGSAVMTVSRTWGERFMNMTPVIYNCRISINPISRFAPR